MFPLCPRVRFPLHCSPGLPNQPGQLFSKFRAKSRDLPPAFRPISQWVSGATRLGSPVLGHSCLVIGHCHNNVHPLPSTSALPFSHHFPNPQTGTSQRLAAIDSPLPSKNQKREAHRRWPRGFPLSACGSRHAILGSDFGPWTSTAATGLLPASFLRFPPQRPLRIRKPLSAGNFRSSSRATSPKKSEKGSANFDLRLTILPTRHPPPQPRPRRIAPMHGLQNPTAPDKSEPC